MWRRKEGLNYWLDRSENPANPVPRDKKIEKRKEKARFWSLAGKVQGCPLTIRIPTAVPGDLLCVPSAVKDGLDVFGNGSDFADCNDTDTVVSPTFVHGADLMETVPVSPLQLPDEDHARVRRALLTFSPYCRRFKTHMGPVLVRSPETVRFPLPRTAGRGALIQDNPAIKSLMPQARDLPFYGKSLEIDLLPEDDKEDYLQEARQKRGFSAEECELVAVFRHVPIEMISKLHFLHDEKAIVFTISGGLKRSGTRVYDLIVVRDGEGEIHLVAHGTRNRMVVFN
jgi:hypothetical protein